MSLSARLILLLTVAVGAVMALGGYFILRQREEIHARALQNELYAHAITLRQSLMNICINALHAMVEGGRLLIEVAPEERRGNGATFVGLRVSDTGFTSTD